MAYDARFGPFAQTPAQRAVVLEQLQVALPGLRTKATAYARQLYARYVAGELSWADVRQTLDATERPKPKFLSTNGTLPGNAFVS